MADAAYYGKPVLLDRHKHAKLRLRPGTGFGFARALHSLHVAAAEFSEACKDYAVVFTRAPTGEVTTVAVLGLRAGENLFVDADDRWDARYVPAFVRRYPFVLAQLPGQALAVCIDESCAGLGEDDGQPLFDEHGAQTAVLRNAVEFLEQVQREHARTQAFCRRVDEAGLLQPMNARATLVDGRAFTLDGLLVVDEKKLLALPDAAALALFRSGELALLAMHLMSLSNMQRLVDRMARHASPIPAAPEPAG